MAIYLKDGEIQEKIINELNSCEKFSVLVAWADSKNKVFESIMANINKLNKFVIGISFNETDPNVFRRFFSAGVNEKISIHHKAGHLFHPKVYAFIHGEKTWSAIIGSANLTYAAFNANVERAVYVAGTFGKDGNFDIFEDIDALFNDGYQVAQDFIEDYERLYKKTKEKPLEPVKPPISRLITHTKHSIKNYYGDLFLAIQQFIHSYHTVLNAGIDYDQHNFHSISPHTPVVAAKASDAKGRLIYIENILRTTFSPTYPTLLVKGSCGQATHWTDTPYIRFMDSRETTKGTRGIYILFQWIARSTARHPYSAGNFRIALTQGENSLIQEMGEQAAKQELSNRAIMALNAIEANCKTSCYRDREFSELPHHHHPAIILEKIYSSPLSSAMLSSILDDLNCLLNVYQCLIDHYYKPKTKPATSTPTRKRRK